MIVPYINHCKTLLSPNLKEKAVMYLYDQANLYKEYKYMTLQFIQYIMTLSNDQFTEKYKIENQEYTKKLFMYMKTLYIENSEQLEYLL